MKRATGRRRRSALVLVPILAVALAAPAAGNGPTANQHETKPSTRAAQQYEPTHLLVRFAEGIPEHARQRVRERHEVEKVRDLPLSGLELVRIQDAASPPARAREMGRENVVRYAEPDHYWQAASADPEFAQQWSLENTGQTGGKIDADVDAPEAWSAATSTAAAVVGVIDTGVDLAHPDLAPNAWHNPGESGLDAVGRDRATNGLDDDLNGYVDDVHGWDFWNNDASVFDELDGDFHGTHVAGTIAAKKDNGIGVAGMSNAKVMSLKFLGPLVGGLTSGAILAIDYAIKNGADLTNNSWGGGGYSQALRDKIAEADSAGQLFIAAAGNSGINTDYFPVYPAGYNVPNVVSVAATTHTDALASWSNYGSDTVDLGAPGDGVLSTMPRLGKAVLRGRDTGADVPYTTALHTFGLEGMLDVADRVALVSSAMSRTGATPGTSILVVDDAHDLDAYGYRIPDAAPAYEQALAAAGYSNVTVHTVASVCDQGPDALELARYEVVVWFTGYRWSCTLLHDDQTNLTTYLSTGGDLLLFGVDIGYDVTTDGIEPNAFFDGVLGADYVADYDNNLRPSGVPGTPYGGVAVLELGSDQVWSSAIAARPGAVVALRGALTAWLSGTSMAAPHVAGAAAHLLAVSPGTGHLEFKRRLMTTGDPLAQLSGVTVSGRRLNLANAQDVPPPPSGSYTLTASPTDQRVRQGGTAEFTVTVTPSDGFTGEVRLSAAPLPEGTSATFTPNPVSVSGPANAALMLTTSSTTKPGKYTITLSGTSGDQTRTTKVVLQVQKGRG